MIDSVPARLRWLSVSDPGLASLRSAARAAIVMPCVFAIADKAIAEPQLATFAAFGSFALLVLVEFGGPLRSRLVAHVSPGRVGAPGTAPGAPCSPDARRAPRARGALPVSG